MRAASHYTSRKGWVFTFQPNVHMYAHSLKATKADKSFYVPCEDTTENHVGIWPYQLDLDPAVSQDLLEGLREWAVQSRLSYRLYETRERYETRGSYLFQRLRKLTLILLILLGAYALTWRPHV